jgi:hypothetical protein
MKRGYDQVGDTAMMFVSKYFDFGDDDSVNMRAFGREIPCEHATITTIVLGSWGDWLWLYPLDYHNVTPFTARADIYDLV